MGQSKYKTSENKYLLKVFNSEVRALVKANRHHDEFEDFWAEGSSIFR